MIRDALPEDAEPIRLFLAANGWAHRVQDAQRFAQLLQQSQRTAVCVDDGTVIGFARAITDELSNGYLSMVVVASGHRRQGVGRGLVEHVTRGGADITWVLRAGRDGAAEFFAALGFEPSLVAMERCRRGS
jgi:GNAT superfamily N-acetyltransferase